ncbi:MAG: MFS transporter [Phycisphaerae bacterium]|nr:MFS transporter [Phycisphaerae bacterium]
MTTTDTTTPPDSATRLPRPVILLGWVSFLADVSSEMVYPLIPMFVVGVLGASATTLGGIEGGAALVVAFVTAWAGFRSDRHRRRVPYVRIGYGLPVIGKSLMALAFAWPMVLTGRLIDRLGKGLRASPRDALIADAAGPAIRGRAFGFHRAMDTAGAMVGVLLAAGLLWWFTGSPAEADAAATPVHGTGWAFRVVFGISAALGLLSLALTFLVRESEAPAQVATPKRPAPAGRLGLPGSYWRTVAIVLVFSLANSSDAFLLLRAREVGLSPWAVVLAYALFNLTYSVISYPAGLMSDRLGRWRVIALGWAIYAAVYAGFAFTGLAWGAAGIWPLLALYGVYMALTDGVSKALVADHAPLEKRGTALGIFYMASGLVTLLASIVAGVLWDRVGPSATFGAGAVVAVIAVVLVPVLRPRATVAGRP